MYTMHPKILLLLLLLLLLHSVVIFVIIKNEIVKFVVWKFGKMRNVNLYCGCNHKSFHQMHMMRRRQLVYSIHSRIKLPIRYMNFHFAQYMKLSSNY